MLPTGTNETRTRRHGQARTPFICGRPSRSTPRAGRVYSVPSHGTFPALVTTWRSSFFPGIFACCCYGMLVSGWGRKYGSTVRSQIGKVNEGRRSCQARRCASPLALRGDMGHAVCTDDKHKASRKCSKFNGPVRADNVCDGMRQKKDWRRCWSDFQAANGRSGKRTGLGRHHRTVPGTCSMTNSQASRQNPLTVQIHYLRLYTAISGVS